MYKKYVVIGGLIACAIWLSGCASTRLEMDYGTSHKLSKMNQILNPDAEKNLTPVEGINGQAAQVVVDKYVKSFEKSSAAATPAPSYGVGIVMPSK
jgi:hypothetical protein